MFRGAKKEPSSIKDDEEPDSSTYNEKELNYYTSNDEPPEPEEKP